MKHDDISCWNMGKAFKCGIFNSGVKKMPVTVSVPRSKQPSGRCLLYFRYTIKFIAEKRTISLGIRNSAKRVSDLSFYPPLLLATFRLTYWSGLILFSLRLLDR